MHFSRSGERYARLSTTGADSSHQPSSRQVARAGSTLAEFKAAPVHGLELSNVQR